MKKDITIILDSYTQRLYENAIALAYSHGINVDEYENFDAIESFEQIERLLHAIEVHRPLSFSNEYGKDMAHAKAWLGEMLDYSTCASILSNEQKVMENSLNWDEIKSVLIKSAARWCNKNASHVLYSINRIQKSIDEDTIEFGDTYWIGFHLKGVDGTRIITRRISKANERDTKYPYLELFRIEVEENELNQKILNLYKVNYFIG